MKKNIKLKYGRKIINIPNKDWKNVKIFLPNKTNINTNLKSEVLKSINNPITTKPLKELLKGKNDVSIIIPDVTRKARCDEYLPVLIREIKNAGINENKINIIVANGTHTIKGIKTNRKIVGRNVSRKIKIIDHDCDDKSNLIYIGRTSRGNEVNINKIFYESDIKIATGVIGFHYFAGFNGGRKAILPGVAARSTIEFNHKLFLGHKNGFNKDVEIGKLKGNPINEDMQEAAKLAKVDFLVNFIYDEKMRLIKAFSGDIEKAHLEGAKYIQKYFRLDAKNKADLVIVSCGGYPKDINFVQAHKSLQNASYIVKDGGTIIFFAECIEGLGSPTLYDWFQYKTIEELEEKLKHDYRMNGHTALSMLLKAKKYKIIFVTKMRKEIVNKMGAIHTSTLKEALGIANIKKSNRIYVIPEGSTTLVQNKNSENNKI